MTKKVIIVLGLIAVCAGVWLALRDRSSAAVSPALLDFGFSKREMIKFGKGKPYLLVDVYPFAGSLATPKPIFLEADYELEFVPMRMEGTPRDCKMQTYIIDGQDEKLIDVSTPAAVGMRPPQGDDTRYAALEEARVRIDLSPYRSRQLGLEWRLECSEPDQKAAIGNLKILLKKETRDQQKPDILYICSDTHRYDYALGEKGSLLMPRLHELVKDSVVYHKAYSSASWTLPSLASLFTGRSPRFHRTGTRVRSGDAEELQKNPIPNGQFLFTLGKFSTILSAYPEQLTTITELLQQQGYYTVLVVSNPLYTLSGLHIDGHGIIVAVGVEPGYKVNRAALRIIEKMPKDRPLFLLVHYMDVHQFSPWFFQKKYPSLPASSSLDEFRGSYGDAVREVDTNLGAVLDKWNEVIGLKDSLVVFFSDHGEHLYESVPGKQPGATRKLGGHGNTMDDLLLRVPLVVKYPSRYQLAGKDVSRRVSLIDIYPTVLEIIGQTDLVRSSEGKSLLRLAETSSDKARYFYADYQLYGKDKSSIRKSNWKLVKNLETGGARLIDDSLPSGPNGDIHRVAQEPEVQKGLERAFRDYVKVAAKESGKLSSKFAVDQKEALEGLRSLGYVR